ncbi:hypothetical protein [Catenulispora yoronensis]
MMIAAAVVPHPPVLVPEIAQGFAPDLDALRAACDLAVGRLYAAGPDEILIVGAGDRQSTDIAVTGSFREYGLDLAVDGRWPAAGATSIPMTLPFLIGAWLLRDRPATPVRHAAMVDGSVTGPLPLPVTATGRRQALLVLGDGSASRTQQAPGHFDERAEPYDAAVARALATVDTKALAALDPDLSRALHVAGLPAWQALAAAAEASAEASDVEYDAELLYEEAPYGVGYFVATWIAR